MNQRLYDTECVHCGETLWIDHFAHDGFEVVCESCAVDLGTYDNDCLLEERIEDGYL